MEIDIRMLKRLKEIVMTTRTAHRLVPITAFSALVIVMLIALHTVSIKAAPTELLNYQGRLTDSNGVPLADGSYDMTFRICSASDCSAVEWTGVWDSGTSQVSLTNGLFSVNLGSYTTISGIDWSRDLWLEVTVGATTYTPRQRMTGISYSMFATDIADDSVTSAKVLDNSLTASDLLVNVVSSVEGVTNDGGNIDLVAGSGISISSNDTANTITIAASAAGIDHGTLSGLGDDDHSQYVLDAGDTMTGTLNSQDVIPTTTNLYALGSTTNIWSTLHIAEGGYTDESVTSADLKDGAALAEILDDDGTGSSLDADLLDGQHGSYYMAASTDNWVNVTGDTMTGTLNSRSLIPTADNSYDLGSSSNEWRNLYVDSNAYLDAVNIGGTITMNNNIISGLGNPANGDDAMDRDYADARYIQESEYNKICYKGPTLVSGSKVSCNTNFCVSGIYPIDYVFASSGDDGYNTGATTPSLLCCRCTW